MADTQPANKLDSHFEPHISQMHMSIYRSRACFPRGGGAFVRSPTYALPRARNSYMYRMYFMQEEDAARIVSPT